VARLALHCSLTVSTVVRTGVFVLVCADGRRFAQWAPSLQVVSYYGNQAERNEMYTDSIQKRKFNVVLTTYEYVIHKIERGRLAPIKWEYLVRGVGFYVCVCVCMCVCYFIV
jgi:hypothetical protein